MEKIFNDNVVNFKYRMLEIFAELQEAYVRDEDESEILEENKDSVLSILEQVFLYVREFSKKYWSTKSMLKQLYHMENTGEYEYLWAMNPAERGFVSGPFVVNRERIIMAARWLEYYYRVWEQPYQMEGKNQAVKKLLAKIENPPKAKMKSLTAQKNGKSEVPFPVRLYEYTQQYVIGQPELKKLAMAIHRYVNLGMRDVVLIKGPTGSGKNYAVEVMSKFEGIEDKMTVLTWDLSQITPSGFNGPNMEDIITAFGKKCMEEGKPRDKGIIILNECDKLMQPNTDSHGEDVNAISQQQLLTILEGKNTIRGVDTSNIMFILLGAFGRVDDMLEEQKQKNSFGFGREETITVTSCSRQSNLRNDIIRQGAQRELIGRISTVLELRKLEKADIKRILLHPETGIIHKKKVEFKNSGMELDFTEGAIEKITEEIMKENLGARSVVNIVNEIVDKYQYDMFECGYSKMIVHEGMFEKDELPRFEGGEVYEKVACAV